LSIAVLEKRPTSTNKEIGEGKMKRAVVLLSGGLDSTVTAYIAKQDIGALGELFLVTFRYNQRHYKEILSARLIGQKLEAKRHEFLDIPLGSIVSTALTGQKEVKTDGISEGIPTTWVPMRNAIFLSFAFALAETVDADFVYIGVNSLDYSGYPDCRQQFIESMNKALNLASKRFVETGKGFGLITPIIRKTKVEIIQWGIKLGAPLGITWSCYKGGDYPCGECDSCRIRNKAFVEAGIKDPALDL
jgi:7-cyano-7-deazaguanine synthase